MVAELLQSQVLVGSLATKEQVLNQIQEAECVHFATHVSWKLSSLVLSPAEVNLHGKEPVSGLTDFFPCFQVLDQSQSKRLYITDNTEEDEGNEVSTTAELPPLTEFLLSAADILSLRLSARLVVVSVRLW